MLISVLLPVYNAWPYLQEALDSIINQTIQNWELIIINDGSTDESTRYLRHFNNRKGRVKLVEWKENRGLIIALNTGLLYCKGEYIARMDADDISLPHRFETQLRYLKEHSELDGVGSYFRQIGTHTGDITLYSQDWREVKDRLVDSTTVPHPTYFMKKYIYDEFRYDSYWKHVEDLEWLFRVTQKYKLANVPEVLLFRRRHSRQVEVQHKEEQRAKGIELRRKIRETFNQRCATSQR